MGDVIRDKTKKQLSNPVPSIERKTSLKQLGMTFNENRVTGMNFLTQ